MTHRVRRALTVLVAYMTVISGNVCAGHEPGANASASRPNILWICCDDLASWALGCYGNTAAETPRLDRLAKEGVLFRNAFVCTPVCSPSRAATLTGRYPLNWGISDWIDPQREADLGLAPTAVTFAERLQSAGYATALCGKWHLGALPKFHPRQQGFDRFFGFLGGSSQPMNPRLERDGTLVALRGANPDLLTDQAETWLKQWPKNPSAVNFLGVHFREPHAPYAPVPAGDSNAVAARPFVIPDVAGLPRDKVLRLTREYAASVHAVDRNVGRLLDAIDALGLREKTMVIFTSDHGYMIGHHGLWHKGNATWLVEGKTGHRPNMFDNSLRVPILIRLPGTIRPGSEITHCVSNIDWFPTLSEIARATPTEGEAASRPTVPGQARSFAPLLGGAAKAKINWDETIYGQYDMHHYQIARMRMIRTPDWKWIRHYEDPALNELYHLAQDPGELQNRASDPDPLVKTVRNALDQRLGEWMKEQNDPILKK